jgi:hypothetical protein
MTEPVSSTRIVPALRELTALVVVWMRPYTVSVPSTRVLSLVTSERKISGPRLGLAASIMIGWSPNSVRCWLTTATGRSVRSTLSTATSSSIERLTSCASSRVPSLRWTVIDSAASTASAVVMRWPSLRNTTAVLLTTP